MIPEGWAATTIGQHADVLTGFAFKSAEYTSDAQDVKLLRGDNIAPHRLRWRDVKRFPIGRAKEVTRYQLRTGDFVVAMDRTWLPSGVKIAEVTDADLPCLLVQRVARLRAKDTLHQGLMKQFFSGHHFDQHVQAVQTETAVPHISPGDLRDYPVLLPPLPEQRRIAEILSTWDRAIETVEALIANARAQKRALMQSLLTGKQRLPGFSGLWTEMTLNKIAKVTMGSSPPSTSYNELGEGLPLIQGNADIKSRVSAPRVHTSLITQRCLPDDVLFSVRAPVGEIAKSLHHACIGRGIAAIQARSSDDAEFLYHVLIFAEPSWAKLSQGSTFQAVNSKDLKGFTFPAPVNAIERQQIGRVVAEAQEAELLLQAQLTTLRQEKSALMQQLLTGKRRVQLDESDHS